MTRPVDLTQPNAVDAEAAVLGAVMLAGPVLPALVGDEGLTAEHFYRDRHKRIYTAMVALHDRGAGVDPVSLCGELDRTGSLEEIGGQTVIESLAAYAPSAANGSVYARQIIDAARWRDRLTATFEMQAAAHQRDEDAFANAEGLLARPMGHGRKRTWTTSELAERLWQRLESGEQPERFPWPFRRLNALTRGGMARGQVTLVAGPTSHGKSVLADMALESGGVQQHVNAHLFLNEMTEEERTARTAGRLSDVSWDRIFTNELTPDETMRVGQALTRLRFSMTECAGWTPREICREARRRSYDLIAVDLINKLPYRHQTRLHDLSEASVEFNALAKDTGCHVLLVAHVNRNRAGLDGRRPNPTLTDIKDCAALADDADNVLFVWREQDDETGDPTENGIIRFGKARGGKLGGLDVTFDGEHMRFEPATTALAVAA